MVVGDGRLAVQQGVLAGPAVAFGLGGRLVVPLWVLVGWVVEACALGRKGGGGMMLVELVQQGGGVVVVGGDEVGDEVGEDEAG